MCIRDSPYPRRFKCFPLYRTSGGFAIARRVWRFFVSLGLRPFCPAFGTRGTKFARMDILCSKTVPFTGAVMETSHEFAFPFAQIMICLLYTSHAVELFRRHMAQDGDELRRLDPRQRFIM